MGEWMGTGIVRVAGLGGWQTRSKKTGAKINLAPAQAGHYRGT
jgi:hypothetical protein